MRLLGRIAVGSGIALLALGIIVVAAASWMHAGPDSPQLVAVMALKGGILQAELEFRRDGAVDGRFGHLAELCGAVPIPSGRSPLLPPSYRLTAEVGILDLQDYHYTVYLPTAADRGTRALSDTIAHDHVPLSTRHFVAYAWPITVDARTDHQFAITEAGVVYLRRLPHGIAPAIPTWNALMGGKDWGDPPVWEWYDPERFNREGHR